MPHGIKPIGHNSITCYQCGKCTPVEHVKAAMMHVQTYGKNVTASLKCGHAIVITSKISFFSLPYSGDREVDDWGEPIRKGV